MSETPATEQKIEVEIERDASEEVSRLEQIFSEVGVRAEVRAVLEQRSGVAAAIPWVVYVTAPVQAFLVKLAANAADDAWKALRDFVHRLCEERRLARQSDGSVVLQESGGLTLVLNDNIPDEAFRELVEKRLAGDPNGYFVWDTPPDEPGKWFVS
jgi:hypothetical protein